MARTYTLKRRAVQQAQTRLRIVEAAVKLHGTVGPALTTISMVADEAGVQRHTLYAHFPTERSLFMACSALSLERSPMPDPEGWRALEDRSQRLRTGLGEIYGWYERNAELAACVLRDVEHHDLTKEIVALRYGPYIEAYQEVLGAGLTVKQRAVLRLAISFFTWRTLVRESGLSRTAAVGLLVQALDDTSRTVRHSA
jgi:AcrR family transcriptional regulator